MKIVFSLILIFLILLFQIGIVPHISIDGVFVNLILISILCLSILVSWKSVLGWIIAGGFFLDFYSNGFLGLSVIALVFSCFFAYFLSRKIFKEKNFVSLLLVLIPSLFSYRLLIILLLGVFRGSFIFDYSSFGIWLLYNLVFSVLVFYISKYLHNKFFISKHEKSIPKI
ncbi:MAG: rod shape-determining protein MreD [Candidatus Portnoybacteria bacterium]|nr:rod shape-determining protein MreD [Candidatus Portnoybacteria bacterium]